MQILANMKPNVVINAGDLVYADNYMPCNFTNNYASARPARPHPAGRLLTAARARTDWFVNGTYIMYPEPGGFGARATPPPPAAQRAAPRGARLAPPRRAAQVRCGRAS